jgi:hypothetical protein
MGRDNRRHTGRLIKDNMGERGRETRGERQRYSHRTGKRQRESDRKGNRGGGDKVLAVLLQMSCPRNTFLTVCVPCLVYLLAALFWLFVLAV